MPFPTPSDGSLEHALPAELTGSSHGWFGRYRTYPVFSAAWTKGRMRSWGAALLLFHVAVMGSVFVAVPAGRFPLIGLVTLALETALPTIAGPWLCMRVRRLNLAPAREWAALVAAVAVVVAAMGVFHVYGAPPLKLAAARALGEVDASGKRSTVRVALGLSVLGPDADTPESAASAPAGPRPPANASAEPGAAAIVSYLAIMFALAGGLALFGYRKELAGLAQWRREQALRQAEGARREAELRLSVLAAQVEPHFLFNTLAGVRSAVRSDPARAAEMIDRLVDYLRASIPRLRGESTATATVGAQADIVRAYLGLMSSRMPRLRFSVDMPDDLLGAHCPPLLLISLAENAVKHGVEPKIGPAQVTLRAERSGSRLTLSVADDGVGFAPAGVEAAGSGLGLVNIRERLAALYGEAASLNLVARPGGGVIASISLPFEASLEPRQQDLRRA